MPLSARDCIPPSTLNTTVGWVQSTIGTRVCNAGITYGSLAVFEDHTELAKSLIDRAVKIYSAFHGRVQNPMAPIPKVMGTGVTAPPSTSCS